VVQASNLLAKRLSRAFADEWFALGEGSATCGIRGASGLGRPAPGLADSQAQFIFLAAEADQRAPCDPI